MKKRKQEKEQKKGKKDKKGGKRRKKGKQGERKGGKWGKNKKREKNEKKGKKRPFGSHKIGGKNISPNRGWEKNEPQPSSLTADILTSKLILIHLRVRIGKIGKIRKKQGNLEENGDTYILNLFLIIFAIRHELARIKIL